MKRFILLTAVALVSACSGGGGGDKLQPGKWDMVMKLTDIEVPGAPPEMAAQMKQAMASQGTQTQSHCMTAAEAANPAGSFGNPGGTAQGCEFTKQTFAGGVIDVAGSCPGPGGKVETTMTGTYTATTMDMKFSGTAQAAGKTVRTSGTMTGKRTGDCAA